jgi:hypothetical protein
VSVVPSAVPLAVPALGVMPAKKPVWGDAPAPGLFAGPCSIGVRQAGRAVVG